MFELLAYRDRAPTPRNGRLQPYLDVGASLEAQRFYNLCLDHRLFRIKSVVNVRHGCGKLACHGLLKDIVANAWRMKWILRFCGPDLIWSWSIQMRFDESNFNVWHVGWSMCSLSSLGLAPYESRTTRVCRYFTNSSIGNASQKSLSKCLRVKAGTE
jgi:hypothetical protein